MIAMLKQQLIKLQHKSAPYLKLAVERWRQLQPREQQMVGGLLIFLTISMLFVMFSSLISFKKNLQQQVNELNQFSIYSKQAASIYKDVASVQANSFNQVDPAQVKSDITQVMQIKDPDVLVSDGQMTITVANAQFTKLIILLEQFRRSYALFPSQLTITRLSQSGFVSFSATFWVKQ